VDVVEDASELCKSETGHFRFIAEEAGFFLMWNGKLAVE
jgi:hypothetical protein